MPTEAPNWNTLIRHLPQLDAPRNQYDEGLLDQLQQALEKGVDVSTTVFLNLPPQLAEFAKRNPRFRLIYSPVQPDATYVLVDGKDVFREDRKKFWALRNSLFTASRIEGQIERWPQVDVHHHDVDWLLEQLRSCEQVTRETGSVEELHRQKIHPTDIYQELERRNKAKKQESVPA